MGSYVLPQVFHSKPCGLKEPVRCLGTPANPRIPHLLAQHFNLIQPLPDVVPHDSSMAHHSHSHQNAAESCGSGIA
jgi:hypothetical protein